MFPNDDERGNRPEENRGANPPARRDAPELAAAYLRAGGASDPGSLPWDADIAGEAGAQAESLTWYAEAHGLFLTRAAIARFGRALDRGAEHVVRVTSDGRWAVKVTLPGEEGFGAIPYVEVEGNIKLRKGTPLEYLDRLHLQNTVFNDDIRLAGFVKGADGSVNIVTFQRFIVAAEPPAHPNAAEIDRFMNGFGFISVAGTEGKTFYRLRDNVAVFDAHEGNFIKTAHGLAPIDLVTVHPDDRLLEALERGLDAWGAAGLGEE